MPAPNIKFQYQFSLIARLRELAGTVNSGYINQKEFFIATLQNMSESLMDLKRETLREACDGFSAKLDGGLVTEEAVIGLKVQLDKILSNRDFSGISAAVAGSKELIKARLAALQPLSIVDEEKKLRDRDQGADRLVTEAYTRLKFEALEKELALAVNKAPAIDKILTQARASVAEYCCLYRVPLREDDTLTPFSLSRIDAVVGACFRLMSRIRSGGRRA